MKFLLWALFIVLLIWLMRGKKSAANATTASARTAGGIEAMRQCTYCGTYVPESEAVVTAAGKVFCSDEHRLRHAS